MTIDASLTLHARLADLAALYVSHRNRLRPVNRPMAVKSIEHILECVKTFSRFLGRPARLVDLTPGNFNRFLESQLLNGKSEYTVRNRRTGLLVLWRHAARLGLVPWPLDVKTVRVNPLAIDGYDEQAITRLVEYATTLRGVMRGTGLRKRDWWETFILVDWELGLRGGDMLRIEPKHFDGDSWLWVVEQKTGKRGYRHLRQPVAELLAAFIAADPERQWVWPGVRSKRLSVAFSRLAYEAGVGGTLRWIRRGAASEVERQLPGSGWRFLRHSVPTLFDRHYRVAKICEQQTLAPPAIQAKVFRPEPAQRRAARQQATPKPAERYDSPTQIPMPAEVRQAFLHRPLDKEDLAAIAKWLQSHGVPQRRLAAWWGYKFKFYQNLRYGYKNIPAAAAERLCRTFGVETPRKRATA